MANIKFNHDIRVECCECNHEGVLPRGLFPLVLADDDAGVVLDEDTEVRDRWFWTATVQTQCQDCKKAMSLDVTFEDRDNKMERCRLFTGSCHLLDSEDDVWNAIEII